MITAAGNCANCQLPVSSHPRRPTGTFVSASAPPAVVPVAQQPLLKGDIFQGQEQVVYASAIRLESHATNHMPVYDSTRGGYVTGTGVNGDVNGNFNNYGNSGVGVNNTPEEAGTVAYGGALGAPYGNDPYSVTRHSRSAVHPPPAQQPHQPISSADYSAAYGDPYSVKRK